MSDPSSEAGRGAVERPAAASRGAAHSHEAGRRAGLVFGLAVLVAGGSAGAGVVREQVIPIQAGWNAVHLEVSPTDSNPAAVFAGKPIDIAARYFRLITPVEFIENPEDAPWQREGWGVWYAPDREDAFLTSLYAIQGNQSYLIHATEAFQWSVTGEVRHVRRVWRNDSFNLVGFPVDPRNPPTFARLFEGAGGAIGQRIYRLQNGKWTKVLSPTGTTVRSGEAFWTFCSGKTDFQGPLDLEVPGTGTLDFGDVTRRLSVRWRLTAPAPAGVSVEVLAAGAGSPALPVRRIERDLETLTETQLPLTSSRIDGAGGASSGKLALTVHQEDLAAASQAALLKFSDGAGSVVWVPATASRAAE